LYCSSHFEVCWLWTSKSCKDKARTKHTANIMVL
jgi:hypothetical protein